MDGNCGFVKIYRSLLGWEWFGDAKTLQLFLCCVMKANIRPCKWRGISLLRGEFVSSIDALGALTGQTTQEIRTRLDRLVSTGEITKRSTNRYTIINVCKFNDYQTSPGAVQQAVNKPGDTLATCCQQDGNIPTTTVGEVENEKKASNTHTDEVSGKFSEHVCVSADTRTHVLAGELLAWVETRYPAVQRMAEPLTKQNMVWMLSKYAAEDIRRLIASIDNKGATRNKSAYTTFVNYARHDTVLRALAGGKVAGGPVRYTWDEVLAYVHKTGCTTGEFEMCWSEGVKYWIRKQK